MSSAPPSASAANTRSCSATESQSTHTETAGVKLHACTGGLSLHRNRCPAQTNSASSTVPSARSRVDTTSPSAKSAV